MLDLQEAGAVVFDYGNNLRGQALLAGNVHALDFPGFVPAFIRPLFCRGIGPFRWAALSGDPADIYRTDELVLDLFPENEGLARWMRLAAKRFTSRACPRASAGWAMASAQSSAWHSMNWCAKAN